MTIATPESSPSPIQTSFGVQNAMVEERPLTSSETKVGLNVKTERRLNLHVSRAKKQQRRLQSLCSRRPEVTSREKSAQDILPFGDLEESIFL